jgi:hypothetical protein
MNRVRAGSSLSLAKGVFCSWGQKKDSVPCAYAAPGPITILRSLGMTPSQTDTASATV